MKVSSFAHGLDLMAPTPGYVRTSGLHISEIYGDYYKRIDPKRYDKRDKKTGEPLPLPEDRVGFGSRFEEALEPQLRDKWNGERPGEFATQHEPDCVHRRRKVRVGDPVCPCGAGIIYSPDYLFYPKGGECVLGEFKLTWYSSREFPTHVKFAKWMTQIKFYLRNLHMNTAWVFPFWVNGGTDNKYHAAQPEFKKAWVLQFSDRETEDTHQRMIRHARKYGFIKEA